jgi:leucyl-tRNA synthetase
MYLGRLAAPGPFGWQAFFGVAPFAPHLAEELWSRMGGDYSVHEQGWPAHDPSAMRADRVTVAIQVDGKTRDRMEVRLEPIGTMR